MPARRTAKPVTEVASQKSSGNSHARRTTGRKRRLRPGQPYVTSKLTDELTARLCVEIRRGLPYGTCCRLVHLSERSFHSWMARAEVEIEEGKQSEYVDFYHKVWEANAEAQRTTHALVLDVNPALILTRRWPQDYPSERLQMELSGRDGQAIEVNTSGSIKILTALGNELPSFTYRDESASGSRAENKGNQAALHDQDDTDARIEELKAKILELRKEIEMARAQPPQAVNHAADIPGRLAQLARR
jgi:hypothetical protein